MKHQHNKTEYLPESQEKKLFKGGSLIIIFLIVGAYLLMQYIIDKKKFPDINVTDNINILTGIDNILSGIDTISNETEYEKFESLKKNGTIINLINKPIYSSFNPSDPEGNNQKVVSIYKTYGERIPQLNINKGGYLYIKATVYQDQLGPKDSIYLYFKDNGGHLFKGKSLIDISDKKYTELLFKLDEIYFAELPRAGYDDRKDMGFNKKNIQQILSSYNNIFFFGFVSTSRQGRLESVQIVYE